MTRTFFIQGKILMKKRTVEIISLDTAVDHCVRKTDLLAKKMFGNFKEKFPEECIWDNATKRYVSATDNDII